MKVHCYDMWDSLLKQHTRGSPVSAAQVEREVGWLASQGNGHTHQLCVSRPVVVAGMNRVRRELSLLDTANLVVKFQRLALRLPLAISQVQYAVFPCPIPIIPG